MCPFCLTTLCIAGSGVLGTAGIGAWLLRRPLPQAGGTPNESQ